MPKSEADKNIEMHKLTASQCNNAAWELIEKPKLEPAELVDLVSCAATARHHWQIIGTDAQIAHADLLFAWAMARSEAGKAAIHAALHALSHFESNPSAIWERAFAQSALAAAYWSDGDLDNYGVHYAIAKELGSQLSDEDALPFQAAFCTLPILS